MKIFFKAVEELDVPVYEVSFQSMEKDFVEIIIHKNSKKILIKKIFFQKLGEHLFYSEDNQSWKKAYSLARGKSLFLADSLFEIYYHFIPSLSQETNLDGVITQMPGKIVKILCKEGDFVKKGDTLLIMEAMKMENEIKAFKEGIIKKIKVTSGENVESGVVLVDF